MEITDLLEGRSPSSILIAGQALATWVDILKIPIPAALSAGVTFDFDLLGSKSEAKDHFNVLSGKGVNCVIYIPELFEPTPNSAKIVVRDPINRQEIDYLSSVFGYEENQEIHLKKRAPVVELSDGTLLSIMHPFDCLKSRIHNFCGLPEKRNNQGLEQVKLSIEVMKKYLNSISCNSHTFRGVVYPITEEIISLAYSKDGLKIFRHENIDVLSVIDEKRYPLLFQQKRWPQVLRYVTKKRQGKRGGNMKLYSHSLNQNNFLTKNQDRHSHPLQGSLRTT